MADLNSNIKDRQFPGCNLTNRANRDFEPPTPSDHDWRSYPSMDMQPMWPLCLSDSNFSKSAGDFQFQIDLEDIKFIMSEQLYATPSPSVASEDDVEQDMAMQSFACIGSDDVLMQPESQQPVHLNGPLIASDQIHDKDVLYGRRGEYHSHYGNIIFKSLIREYQPTYLNAKMFVKTKYAQKIVTTIRENGGRFLERSGLFWFDIGDRNAREKTRQALRYQEVREAVVNPTPEATGVSLPDDISVSDNDVVFGRARFGSQDTHVGNQKYHCLILQNQQEYKSSRKLEKSKLAMAIVKEVKSRGGRFLRIRGGRWVEISLTKARESTKQALLRNHDFEVNF